jgi:nitroimidazol reductase NimA-like FMN-containing flavoprotein (pyridoxamine 5'-phosphate oxidase superfamily)
MSDALPVDDLTRIRREAHRQVTDREALNEILDETLIAHVGIVRDGRPIVLPFACARDGDSLLLHGSTGSGLLRVADRDDVCVTVTHIDGLVYARSTFESSMRYRSAVVHGVARAVPEEDKDAALLVLSEHLFPGRTAEVRRSTPKELAATMVLRVPLDRASVKASSGPPKIDPDDDEPKTIWAGIIPLSTVAGEPLPAPDVDPGTPLPDSVVRALGARTRRDQATPHPTQKR